MSKGQRTPTLVDVAARAHVDVSTVSRVLRGERLDRVRPETCARIENAVNELGYRPNRLARALRGAHTSSIGLVIPQIMNPVFQKMIHGVELAARERGFSLLILRADATDSDTGIYETFIQDSRLDGLLVSAFEVEVHLDAALKRVSVPVVMLNRKIASVPNCIVFDSFCAAKMAVEHLLALGHRRIAYISGPLDHYNAALRFEGYRAALVAEGIEYDPALVAFGTHSFESGSKSMDEILSRPGTPPTAAVAYTIVVAIGAMRVLHAHHLSLPASMSMVAIHDDTVAEMLHPSLTTVRLPVEQMGRDAAMGLIDLIEKRRESFSCVLAPERLVVRESTRALG